MADFSDDIFKCIFIDILYLFTRIQFKKSAWVQVKAWHLTDEKSLLNSLKPSDACMRQ